MFQAQSGLIRSRDAAQKSLCKHQPWRSINGVDQPSLFGQTLVMPHFLAATTTYKQPSDSRAINRQQLTTNSDESSTFPSDHLKQPACRKGASIFARGGLAQKRMSEFVATWIIRMC